MPRIPIDSYIIAGNANAFNKHSARKLHMTKSLLIITRVSLLGDSCIIPVFNALKMIDDRRPYEQKERDEDKKKERKKKKRQCEESAR